MRGESTVARSGQGGDLRTGGSGRRRQDHYAAHVVRADGPRRGKSSRGGCGRPPRSLDREGPDRLHGPALRPVWRPDRVREPRLLRGSVRRAQSGTRPDQRRTARDDANGPVSRPRGGKAVGRHEAEARLDLYPAAPARSAAARRADQRRGPAVAARLLDDSLPPRGRRNDDPGQHGVPR